MRTEMKAFLAIFTPHRSSCTRISLWPMLVTLALWGSSTGCNALTGDQPLPAGTVDPASYSTPEGARGMRNVAIYNFEVALPRFITNVGLLTDELTNKYVGTRTDGIIVFRHVLPLDERVLVEYGPNASQPGDATVAGADSYYDLQGVRKFGNQAIGALATYDTVATDTASARVLRGELYAIAGYTEIMLADLFCSGVPLSTLDFEQDYTLHESSTTAQVYHDALAKFDTALTLAVGNDSILNLARVGRGRAWLDLAQYDSASAAVQSVPVGFQYRLPGQWYGTCGQIGTCNHVLFSIAAVADREGFNGLPYISSHDPRSAVVADSFMLGTVYRSQPFPDKYKSSLSGNGTSFITVANGIEAQLIIAEDQLQPADAPRGPWLQTLNTLRESAGLSDTTDPGTASGRIALLFSERAYWLFLTGHRQGDLRRLIRNYHTYPAFQSQSQVYPTGAYTAPGAGVYGSDVTVPIPSTEYTNPLFHGCVNRGA
jgi:hypothetical protein